MAVKGLAPIIHGFLFRWLILPLVCGILLGTVLWSFWESENMEKEQRLRAVFLERYLDDYLNGRKRDLLHVAHNFENKDSAMLTDFVGSDSPFVALHLLGPKGRDLRSIPAEAEGRSDFSGILPEIRSGKEFYLSAPYYSRFADRIVVAMMVPASENRFITGEINLSAMQQAVLQLAENLKQGTVFLTDEYGNILAHPDMSRVNRQENLGDMRIISEAETHEPLSGFFFVDNGLKLMSATRLKAADWVIVVQQDAFVVLKPAMAAIAISVVGLLLLFGFFSYVFYYRLRRSVIRPLNAFAYAIDEMKSRESAESGSVAKASPGFAELKILQERFANMKKAVWLRQKELRESEENLRITLHSIGDAVIATDIEGAITKMNKIAQKLTGWGEDEALGRPLGEVFSIINAFTREPCVNPMQKVLDSGEIQGLANHTVLISRDGDEYQIADSASPIRDREDNVVGVVLVFRDVTEQYRQQERLKIERRRLADAIEGTRAGTWEWNVKTGEVAVNERWAEIIGYRLEEVAPMTFATWEYYTHSGDLERSDELLKKHLNGEVDYYECEVRMLHKNGGWVWVLDRGRVTQWDEDGSPLLVSGTHQDVTEKKKVEENMRLMAEVLENSDNIAVFKDPELKYINVNNAYLNLTGYESPKDVIGKTDTKLFAGLASEAQIREYIDNDRKALGLDSGEVLTAEEYFPDENLDRTFLTKKFPVYSDSGTRLLGVATLATEITEQKNMQREILTAKEKAEAANLAKSQFLANMSHEIRTPLNGIMGMVQLMQSTSLNSEQDEYVRLAYKSTKRLNRLLTDILDLSRIEAGKEEIREEEFSLTEVLRSIKEIFMHSVKDSSNTIEVNSYGEIPERLRGDGTRLTQILFNLAGNACKYTRNGRVAVNVSVLPETISGQSRLLFVVEDNGPGIPDDNIDDIFEVFTQAGKQDNPYARKYEGAGLGLPLVRRLVGLMGGTLSIDSREGEGTAVYVSLPFGVVESEQSGESEEAVFEAENQAVRERNILVVDDDKVTRMYMQRLLEKLGFGADVAEDGDQALSMLADGEYDCLLMDVQMPVMDGVEATRRIRTGETGLADIPIIALTAYAMSGDREKFMDAGMDDYLSKPVDKNELLQMLNRFLD